MTKKYVDLNQFFPYPIVTNRYVISKSVLTNNDIETVKNNWNDYRNENYLSTFVVGKEYVILYDKHNKKTMMSSHEFEMITNQKFLDNAKGDVLIFGLGLGLVIHPLLEDDNVKSITIVEIDSELIDEVFPIIISKDNKCKVNIIFENAFDFKTENKYDTIYFDIWSVIDKSAFIEMKELSNKFRNNLNDGGWMDSWCSEEENIYVDESK